MSQYHKDKNFYDYFEVKDLKQTEKLYNLAGPCINKETLLEYNVQVYDLKTLEEEDIKNLRILIEMMAFMDHPNISKLIEVYENNDKLFMIQNISNCRPLHEIIEENELLSEDLTSNLIFILTSAVKYYQELDIVHRDLNIENIYLKSIKELKNLKIANFSSSKTLLDNDYATTQCGQPGFIAPEVVEGNGYGKEVDIWSIGLILYISLSGFPPFYADENSRLFDMIKKAEYDFPSPYFDDISDQAKDLVKKILVADPQKRATLDEILEHPWIKKYNV